MTKFVEAISETRVLVAAPTAKDAEVTAALLKKVGLSCVICESLETVARLMPSGAGVVLMTDEAIAAGGTDAMLQAIARQPDWSDLPVVLMARSGNSSPALAQLYRSLSNVTVLERPTAIRSVVSAVQAAVRGRLRQYQIRDQLQTIRVAEKRLTFSMDAGKLGAWEVDLATMTMTCSPRCKQNFGRDPGAPFSYQELFEVIHPDDRKRVAELVQHSLRDHADYVAEYRVIWPDGDEHWVDVRGRADYDSVGTPVRIAGVSLEITEQKLVERQRQSLFDVERAARTEAERVGRMKDEFLATLSHELRTPLNAILGWSHLLQMVPANPEDLKEGLATIERNARLQTELIEDLLDMSRIISGKIRMTFRTLSAETVVAAAVGTVQPAASAKGVKIAVDVEPGTGEMSGDPSRLQQVVWNLLSNAIKFTPRGGWARVAVRRRSSQMEIEVTDSGLGIEPDFLPHVFERFRQANAKSTREHGGLGLGLAIVKHLVELHGGRITAFSAGRGTGSTFTIHLPIAPLHVDESDEDHSSGAKPSHDPGAKNEIVNLSGIKVLIVDDEADARELMRRVLRGVNARVVLAASASEALAAVNHENPDVIISDIGMPLVDGYEFVKTVRANETARRDKTPAIALTAFARSEDRIMALSAGYDMHLTKPVEAAELITAVANLARGRSVLRVGT